MQTITFRKPDDWHIHLRDDRYLSRTVADASRQFNRAIVMPNLVPPVTNTEQAYAYRKRIIQHIPAGTNFNPLMTLYLTDNTSVQDIEEASNTAFIKGVKLYPAGATTNSDAGVTNIFKRGKIFKAMEKAGIPLLLHGEVTTDDIDIFDREKRFIDEVLKKLTAEYPSLKIVLEHITTSHAVEFIESSHHHPLAATITAHHLLFNRNHLLAGGIKPHYYCLPVLKRNTHQDALIKAATSGSDRFFLGTDSAPHTRDKKEAACGCAGCYTAYSAIELYAEAFERADALDKLEGFASIHGPGFYGLSPNEETITLRKKTWTVPSSLEYGDSTLTPLLAGEEISWQRANG